MWNSLSQLLLTANTRSMKPRKQLVYFVPYWFLSCHGRTSPSTLSLACRRIEDTLPLWCWWWTASQKAFISTCFPLVIPQTLPRSYLWTLSRNFKGCPKAWFRIAVLCSSIIFGNSIFVLLKWHSTVDEFSVSLRLTDKPRYSIMLLNSIFVLLSIRSLIHGAGF